MDDKKERTATEIAPTDEDYGMLLPTKANIRRVNFNDLEAIMAINDDIYEGLDYMPGLFYTFLHSKQHEMYVYEDDGKVVSMANFQFPLGEKDQVNLMSGRVHPAYQGHGLSKLTLLPLVKHHPQVTRIVAGTMLKPNLQSKLNEFEIVYITNFLHYKLSDRLRIESFVQNGWKPNDATKPIRVSHSQLIRWLDRSDQLLRFVSKYSRNFIPCGPIWSPNRVSREGLRNISTVTNVLVTFARSTPAASLDRNYAAERNKGTDRGTQQERRQLVGFSYSNTMPCKYGVRLDAYFYGDDCDVFISHFATHLRHYLSTTKDDVRLALGVHFPTSINAQQVQETLEGEIGSRVNNEYFSVTQVVHYSVNIAQAKL